MLKLFLLLISVTLISFCSTVVVEQDDMFIHYELTSAHCTNTNKLLAVHKKDEPMDLIFPSIPGGIWGNPTSDILQYVSVIPNKTFSLTLPSDMSQKALRLSQKGLSINPVETKVVRLGTFHFYPDYINYMGGGGFYQEETSDSLILVYFSGASVVTGMQKVGGEVYEFNVRIPKKGWSWIKTSKVSSKKYITTLYDGTINSIRFCAYIPNVINT